MAKKSVKIGGPSLPPLLTFGWVKEQFEQLHDEHRGIVSELDELRKGELLIIKKLGELNEKLDDLSETVPEFVSPELQEQIVKSLQLVSKIDQKVPDLPPKQT